MQFGKKTIIVYVLLVGLYMFLFPQYVSANEVVNSGSCGEAVSWTLYFDGTMVISGQGDMTDYEAVGGGPSVPWSSHRADVKKIVIESGVTSIGNEACVAFFNLESATIADTVTRIGEYAFYNCIKLSGVQIPASVVQIGEYAFSGCQNLRNIVIPQGVTVISDYAFESCVALENIVIPEGVTAIGRGAFKYCPSLRKIELPSSITSIGRNAFEECENLGHILYRGTQEQWGNVTIRYGAFSERVGITYNYVEGMQYHVFENECASVCFHCAFSREADHSWDDGVTVDNVTTYTCSICGDTKVDYVENLDPVFPPVQEDTKPTVPTISTLPTIPTESYITEPNSSSTSGAMPSADDSNGRTAFVAVAGGILLVAIAIYVILVRKKR